MATLTLADLDNGKRDLETVDAVANSQADTTITRYGDSVLTLAGVLRRLGYAAPVPYVSGLDISSGLTTVEKDGVVYRPDTGLVPFTTGAWNPDQWRVVQNTVGGNELLIFDTRALAASTAAIIPDGQPIKIKSDSDYSGRPTIVTPLAGVLQFVDYADLELAEQGGSSRVGFVGSGSTHPITAQDKMRQTVSVSDHGVSASATAAINLAGMNEALTALGSTGGKLDTPVGTHNFSNGVTIVAPVSISGKGGVFSAFNPHGLTDSQDFLTFNPSTDVTGMRLSDFAVHNPSNGTRTGRAAVFVNTLGANKNVSLMKVSGLLVGESGGPGFYHLNDYAVNINGGFFASHLDGNSFKGGIKLENTGDSNNITHNILTGSNIGVDASFVPGASLLEVQANNIANSGGAIRLENGSRPRILGNNIENYAPGSVARNNAAVVNLTGNSGTIFGGVIKENLVSAFGTSDATVLIRVRNTQGILIEDNVLLNGSAATIGIDIGADCANIRVGANTFGPGVTTPVLDNGRGTMGVLKTATLQNGWVKFSSVQSPLQFIKSLEGIVHVSGIIKGGTTTNGTLLTTFPEGFLPAKIMRFMAQVLNAGTPQMVELSLETTGDLRINYAASNDQLTVNFSFPALNLGNAASAE